MEWFFGLPQVPGFYWMHREGWQTPNLVEVYHVPAGTAMFTGRPTEAWWGIRYMGSDEDESSRIEAYYMGPLQIPALPVVAVGA